MVKKGRSNGIYYIIFAWAILLAAIYMAMFSYAIFAVGLAIISIIVNYIYRIKIRTINPLMIANEYLSLIFLSYAIFRLLNFK